jgi:hypothetical protein
MHSPETLEALAAWKAARERVKKAEGELREAELAELLAERAYAFELESERDTPRGRPR